MDNPFSPQPVVLEGMHVRIEPLGLLHAEDLYSIGQDEEIWRYMPRSALTSVEDTQNMIQAALLDQSTIAYAIIHKADNKAVGSTRMYDIQPENRSLEIGWTWIGKPYQRTAVNTECKFLLFTHLFDELNAIRVQLKTDGRNLRSQKAMERLGLKQEGTLRKHRIMWDGFIRDTVYYSVIDTEWEGTKRHLKSLMYQY